MKKFLSNSYRLYANPLNSTILHLTCHTYWILFHAVFGRVVQYTTTDPTTTNLILPRKKKKKKKKDMMSKCAAAISYTQLVKVIHYLVTGKSQEFIHFLTL